MTNYFLMGVVSIMWLMFFKFWSPNQIFIVTEARHSKFLVLTDTKEYSKY